MTDDNSENFCTIDHGNSQRELAQLTPYQFWLDQVKHKREPDRGPGESSTDVDRPRRSATHT